jgi:hypothetical protein
MMDSPHLKKETVGTTAFDAAQYRNFAGDYTRKLNDV